MLDKMDKPRSMYRYSDEEVARVCHAAIREMQDILGEEELSPTWFSDSPDEHQLSIDGVRKARTPGVSPAELHDEWVRRKLELGWVYGPERDSLAQPHPTHPNLVPYNELPQKQRDKDIVFRNIVVAMTASLD